MIELCKRLFPGTDGGKRGEARFTDHRRIVGDLNWLMLRYPLQIAPRDRERWEKAISAARDYAAARQRIQDAPPQMEPRAGSFIGTLMPFQKAGLSWLCATPRALLADEMGLGKTLQALCCLCNTQAFPAFWWCRRTWCATGRQKSRALFALKVEHRACMCCAG